jgi:hypothetical protein
MIDWPSQKRDACCQASRTNSDGQYLTMPRGIGCGGAAKGSAQVLVARFQPIDAQTLQLSIRARVYNRLFGEAPSSERWRVWRATARPPKGRGLLRDNPLLKQTAPGAGSPGRRVAVGRLKRGARPSERPDSTTSILCDPLTGVPIRLGINAPLHGRTLTSICV